MSAEKCARWFRGSNDQIDEENQVAAVDRHIKTRGYDPVRTFTLHAKSAAKGEQEPELAEVLDDIQAGAV
jgi:DNA invertase Pin-like site-specific DNA recombinase